MPMKRCENGHFFDPAKYTTCPYCGVPDLDLESTKPRRPEAREPAAKSPSDPTSNKMGGLFSRGQSSGQSETRGAAGPGPAGRPDPGMTHMRGEAPGGREDREGATIGLQFKMLGGIDPVVGWLVCIEGPEKGRDYRIRNEHNFIGRARNMHIVIESDPTISRERHADLSYDPKSTTFMLMTGISKSLVYLNGKVVLTPMELSHGDILELGESKFMFIPFCGETWQWK